MHVTWTIEASVVYLPRCCQFFELLPLLMLLVRTCEEYKVFWSRFFFGGVKAPACMASKLTSKAGTDVTAKLNDW